MVFFFLIPSIPAVLGNFLLPMMIGARDLAFPRLNLLSWYLYMHRRRVHARAAIAHRRRRHRLDVLHALQHARTRTRNVIADGARRLHHRLLVDPHRPELHRHHPHACARPGMTWFRLPLFVWAHYATSLILVLGTPVLAITAAAGRARARLPHRHLRPRPGRRPGAVPAPVLVLLAPGRLHHDPARHGRDQRARRLLLAQARSSATTSSPSPASPSPCSASWSGATTCSSAGQSVYAGAGLLAPELRWSRSPRRSRSSTGRPRSTRARSRFETPMLYALGLHRPVHHRRPDRPVPRRARRRRPRARHLLRRRALPLHHGRRHGDGATSAASTSGGRR